LDYILYIPFPSSARVKFALSAFDGPHNALGETLALGFRGATEQTQDKI